MIRSAFSDALTLSVQRIRAFVNRSLPKKPVGLKAKITFFILLNVVGVLLLASYIDYQFTKKAQIGLYLDRNLYIAKQIELGVPDQRLIDKVPQIREEMEQWLLSRPSLMEIDVFLFFLKRWEILVSTSKRNVPNTPLKLSEGQIQELKKDKHLSVLREEEGENWLEVVVPLHSRGRVIGGVRVASSLNEVQSYLSKKRNQAFILTFLSILVILITLTLFFRRLVGNPIQKLVVAMSRAEKGDLDAKALIESRDELGELGRHFNHMLKTIRETHEQNIQLLSQVNQFNDELTRKIEAATSELARNYEELKRLNEALFESQRQLSQSEKLAALGEVSAAMAHQIGTPLNSISGYIQLMLQEGNLQPEDRNRLKIIESQLDRLADSVKNLLIFTRQPKPLLKPLNVNEVLEELIRLSLPWRHARNVTLLSSLSSEVPSILGDPTHLQTLFLNLITNALDAMPQGGHLSISTQLQFTQAPSGENGRWVEISIADTGIGITEESKKLIFDPFFTTKKIGEGTGLGLAICEKIIKEHAGRLEVESEVGKGSTFSIFIPALGCEEI